MWIEEEGLIEAIEWGSEKKHARVTLNTGRERWSVIWTRKHEFHFERVENENQ